ncbi:MAG TPA: DUF3604 domain-containing protein, partial [Symbiobacteriaceae bacterium]|nr:DUF3604 domain-containing protein [Symbiobacteriaceae bacterium]
MHQGPFDFQTGRRRTMEEAVQWVRQTYGYEMVNGFDRILDAGAARHNTDRVASFGEFSPYEAWYLDQQQPGALRWLSAPVPDSGMESVVFLLSIGLGNGSALPQPTGYFELLLNGRRLATLRVVKQSETWVSEAATVHYEVRRLETAPQGMSLILDSHLREEAFASFGLLVVKVDRSLVRPGEGATFEVRSCNRNRSTQWLKVDKGTNVRFHSDFYTGMAAVARGRVAPRSGQHNVYFGDIHTHSGQAAGGLGTCGTGSVDENYQYARDVSNLDFYALTEHDWQTNAEHWATLMQKVEEYNAPGRFATIPAFEWTSLVYGHRNVYYADANQPFFLSWQEALAGKPRQPMGAGVDSPRELWAKLDQLNTLAITAPHHPSAASHPLNWDYWNAKYDRLVEIYSSWGSSEFAENRNRGFGCERFGHLNVVDALNRGLRFGLIASSDGHDGNPGNAQSPVYRHHHLWHYLGSGLTAVLADDLSRESVLQALHDRRCYAVTGAPIVLDFRLNDHLMGRELSAGQVGRKPLLTADVTGTTHLTRLEIIKNGRIVWRHDCYEDT